MVFLKLLVGQPCFAMKKVVLFSGRRNFMVPRIGMIEKECCGIIINSSLKAVGLQNLSAMQPLFLRRADHSFGLFLPKDVLKPGVRRTSRSCGEFHSEFVA